MNREKMLRVSRERPCPICGKWDWCLIAPDGSAAICQRIEDGCKKRCGDAGWLHILVDRPYRHYGHCKNQSRNRSGIIEIGSPKGCLLEAKRFEKNLDCERLKKLSEILGVSQASLRRLNVGWDGSAWTFPMRDTHGNVIGIQRRFPDGKKNFLKGSRNGLFVPSGLASNETLLICEGVSDVGSALDLGFEAIGRASCNTGAEMLSECVRGRDVVIIGDNDDAGKKGAQVLALKLALYCPSVKIIFPPEGVKDLRQWKAKGADHTIVFEVISAKRPVSIKVTIYKIEKGNHKYGKC